MGGHRLMVVGDLSALQSLGLITTKKGARVYDAVQQHGFTLWNDLLQPTRVANSVSRDVNPDFTFALDVKKARWTCLSATLGSDRHIIQLEIEYECRPTEKRNSKTDRYKKTASDTKNSSRDTTGATSAISCRVRSAASRRGACRALFSTCGSSRRSRGNRSVD
ncbi:hypothetical protein MTO96_004968 [Rhipicephalus appendiculatus]